MNDNLQIDEYEQGYNQAIKDLDSCDWSAFRREAAKDILVGLCANNNIGYFGNSNTSLASSAIALADELIKQLQEDKK